MCRGPRSRQKDREEPAMPYHHILVDDPRPRVRRITLNRPEKRNALNNRLRAEVFEVLEAADRDSEISISILRGAGPCFSAGYDLSSDNSVDQPYHSAARPPNGDLRRARFRLTSSSSARSTSPIARQKYRSNC